MTNDLQINLVTVHTFIIDINNSVFYKLYKIYDQEILKIMVQIIQQFNMQTSLLFGNILCF